jgi:nucleoid DNA-binding protein
MAKNKTAKSKGLTKSAIYQELADSSGVARKQVAAVFDSLSAIIKRQLKKDGDVITIPGLLKLRLVKKKAIKGGKTIPNPFRPGEMIVTKDKPARNVIKASALKSLKDMVQ